MLAVATLERIDVRRQWCCMWQWFVVVTFRVRAVVVVLMVAMVTIVLA